MKRDEDLIDVLIRLALIALPVALVIALWNKTIHPVLTRLWVAVTDTALPAGRPVIGTLDRPHILALTILAVPVLTLLVAVAGAVVRVIATHRTAPASGSGQS